jgi:hypothetical protein
MANKIDPNNVTNQDLFNLLTDLSSRIDRSEKYMLDGFERIERQLDEKADKSDIDKILGALDSDAKRIEIDEHERIAMGSQIDRINKWATKASKKVGVDFSAA